MLSVFATKQDEACQDVPSKSLIIQCQLFNQILIIIILLVVIICYFLWSWDKLLWGVFAPSPDGGGRNNLEINLVEDKVHELISVGIIIINQDHLLHHYDWDYHHYHVHHPWKRLLVDVIIKYIPQFQIYVDISIIIVIGVYILIGLWNVGFFLVSAREGCFVLFLRWRRKKWPWGESPIHPRHHF